jgi:serine/threonine protein kinase
MQVLQENKISHGDLKPENILVKFNKNKESPLLISACLNDFEEVQFLKKGIENCDNEDLKTGKSIRYSGPEKSKGNNKVNIFSDVWSFGCLLIYIFSALPPYNTY